MVKHPREFGTTPVAIVILLFCLAVTPILLMKNLEEDNKHVISQTQLSGLSAIPSPTYGDVLEYPYDVRRCPACVGTSLCDAAKEGHLKITEKISIEKVLSGKLGSEDIIGKRLINNTLFDQFDNILCEISREDNREGCDIENGLKHLFGSSQVLVGSRKTQLRKAFDKLVGLGMDLRPSGPLLCGSDRFVDGLIDIDTYDQQQDSEETMMRHYQAMMSFVLNPEGQLLKFFGDDSNFAFPKYYGECGRMVIVENGGRMLPEFLSSSWPERVQIVLDIFNLLDQFQTKSDDWLILVPDINLGNFARAPSGDLIFIDLEDAIIIDKKETGIANFDSLHSELKGGKPCNMDCFTDFSDNLFEEPEKYCPLVTNFLDFQHSAVCLVFLTDYANEILLDKDQVEFNVQSSTNVKTGGLLHDPPSDIRDQLNTLVSKCVTESVRGERLHAVNDLKDLLRTALKSRKHDEIK